MFIRSLHYVALTAPLGSLITGIIIASHFDRCILQTLMRICVTLPPSDFADRYLVCLIRERKLAQLQSAAADEVRAWLREHSAAFHHLQADFHDANEAIAELLEIHERLWTLEDLIRTMSDAPPSSFVRTAQDIFALNDRRHELKRTIDEICGVACKATRIYTTGRNSVS